MDATTGYKNRNTLQIVMTYIAVVMTVFSMLAGTTTIAGATKPYLQLQTICLPIANSAIILTSEESRFVIPGDNQ